MTTTSSAARETALARTTHPTQTALAVAAGVALVAGPALFFAGLATSPVQEGTDKASYIASLARDPLLTQVSAVLLHYGNLLMGVGILAVLRTEPPTVFFVLCGLTLIVDLVAVGCLLHKDTRTWCHEKVPV